MFDAVLATHPGRPHDGGVGAERQRLVLARQLRRAVHRQRCGARPTRGTDARACRRTRSPSRGARGGRRPGGTLGDPAHRCGVRGERPSDRSRRRRRRSTPRRCTTASGRSDVSAPSTASRSLMSSARWSAAITSSPAPSPLRTTSRPSWPLAPVTRSRSQNTASGLQRLPPLTVGRGTTATVCGECLVEIVLRPPAEALDLVGRDRVAAVVAEAVVDGLDAALVAAAEREQLARQLDGSAARCGRRCCRSRPIRRRSQHEVDGPHVVLDVEPVADVHAVAVQRDLVPSSRLVTNSGMTFSGNWYGPELVARPGDDAPAARTSSSTRGR